MCFGVPWRPPLSARLDSDLILNWFAHLCDADWVHCSRSLWLTKKGNCRADITCQIPLFVEPHYLPFVFFLLKQAEKHALFWVFFRFRGCGTKTMSSRFTVCFSPKVVCEALYGFIDCTVPSSFHLYFKRGKLFFHTKCVARKPTNDVLLCVLWMPANSSKRAIKVIWSPQANRIMQFPIVR